MPKVCKKEKAKYRLTNWPDYNRSLINRGSITFWFSDDVIDKWQSIKETKSKGRPQVYSDEAIICALTIREVFKLPLRALQGFLTSLILLMKLPICCPSYSQISRRSGALHKKLKRLFTKGAKDIVFDSSGLKVYGEGEWKVRQYGVSKRRTWRKIHIGMDPHTGEILLCEMTTSGQTDAKAANKLIDEFPHQLNNVYGDGSYDDESFRKKVALKGANSIIPPPRNAIYKGGTEKWQRDLDVAAIHCLGGDEEARKIWKKLIGYHKRSLVETTFSRIKRMLGPYLRARSFDNQKVECQIKCLVMNKMVSLGMPKSEIILKLAA
jgi:DDE family transposase